MSALTFSFHTGESGPAAGGVLTGGLNRLSGRCGRGAVLLADADWKERDALDRWSSMLTPQYTTRWTDMPLAKA